MVRLNKKAPIQLKLIIIDNLSQKPNICRRNIWNFSSKWVKYISQLGVRFTMVDQLAIFILHFCSSRKPNSLDFRSHGYDKVENTKMHWTHTAGIVLTKLYNIPNINNTVSMTPKMTFRKKKLYRYYISDINVFLSFPASE